MTSNVTIRAQPDCHGELHAALLPDRSQIFLTTSSVTCGAGQGTLPIGLLYAPHIRYLNLGFNKFR